MAALTLVRSGKNFKVFTDGQQELIMIEKVRISFPAIGHMKENESDDGKITKKYQAVPMLPKATHTDAKNAFKEIYNGILTAAKAKVAPENICLKNGDDKENEEYQNHFIISASDTRRPAARNEKGHLYLKPEDMGDADEMEAILNQIDEAFYGGCWVNILLRPWYFNGKAKGSSKTFPKRICCGIQGIQKYKDDTPFGNGRIDDSSAWETKDDEDGADPMAGDDDDI